MRRLLQFSAIAASLLATGCATTSQPDSRATSLALSPPPMVYADESDIDSLVADTLRSRSSSAPSSTAK